jgi:hypothetical protein
MQWLQNPNQSDVDNLNNVRHEASRQFRNKKKKYLKDEINGLQTNGNNKNVRDLYWTITDSKKHYLPRIHIVKDEEDN